MEDIVERYPVILMTFDEVDEYDNEDLDYTQWDIADATYHGQRAGIAACIEVLQKWSHSDLNIRECIAVLKKL